MGEIFDNTRDTVRRLRAGGVLLLATDTLPGLHCRIDDPAAVRRLNRLKGRPQDKPLLVLAGSLDQVRALTGELSSAQLAACERCWPGPFSLILPAAAEILGVVTGGGRTVAVRVPAVAALCELIQSVGVPLVSSSANLAGVEPALDLTAAGRIFGVKVDGRWNWRLDAELVAAPSALVDLTVTPFVVVRSGPVEFPTG